MMFLELMDKITLNENDEYIVVNITVVDGVKYYLLADEYNDIMIGYIDGNDFVSIENNLKFGKILLKFDPNEVLKYFNESEIEQLLDENKN
ncbi:MAG: hypothetical protein J6O62_03275 [Bacilli bacterium]|nr:hypothetical protein [Bacilli bacterium]